MTGANDAWRLLSIDAFDGATDVEIVSRFRYSSSLGFRNTLMVRMDATVANGYQLRVGNASSVVISRDGGVTNAVGAGIGSVDNNEWWWHRLRVNGTTLQARTWLDGTAEPGTWNNVDTTHASHASGYVGVGSFGTSGNIDFDIIGIALDGGTAPVSA